jgi:hypothetical protein
MGESGLSSRWANPDLPADGRIRNFQQMGESNQSLPAGGRIIRAFQQMGESSGSSENQGFPAIGRIRVLQQMGEFRVSMGVNRENQRSDLCSFADKETSQCRKYFLME